MDAPLDDFHGGFLGSFLSKSLKTNQLEVNTDERTLRTVARLKEPRDLFALPKDRDHDCPQQAARWPTECQVLEERVHHIEYLPEVSEFYYQPTGNELRPRPVGEENGVVVFNYNPVSAVNYAKHSDDDSDSSSESRSPSPKSKANRFSKHFQYRRSSSNSVDEDEDDYDEEIAHTKFVEDRSRSPILVPQIRTTKIVFPQRVPSPKRLAEIAPHPPPARCNIKDIPNITPVHFSGDHNDDNNNINKKEEPPSPQFSRSSVGGSRLLSNAHPCSGTGDCRDLIFESRFESGNLAKAVKITSTYYELYLRPDLYTNRHKQWFYFRVTNTKRNVLYRLSIVNLVKSDSLYNEGMRPLMYSTFNARSKGEGWRRCGDNISYYKNEEEGATADDDDENGSYTLTFNIQFPYDADTVYFAHSYPYTYSDLQDYLMDIQKHPVKSKFCKLRLLCRSLAGNNVYYLTVTAPTFDEDLNKVRKKPYLRRKKAIVVSARVHPGETPASWMMKGLMDFITGDSRAAKQLRHRFIFKLIPMLNPDGVIVGNTRSSLTGKDLNRQYRTVIRETYPSIWYTKAMIKRLIDDCGVAMYCDMHAHSRRHNVFIYGCENKRTPEKKLTEQVFPLMVHKNCADKFSFESCKFKIQRSKEGTGRIVIWMLGVTNSYTMEASFGGSTMGSRNRTHFNTTDYEHMGRSFCETLLDYYDENPSKERLRNKIIDRLNKEGSSADEPLNIQLSDYSSDEGDTSSSSSDNEGKDLSQSDYEGPCCQPLKVPPCSPAYDGGKKIKKTRTKGKSQSQKRPKRQQQKERTPLDLPTTDPGSDIQFSTDDEYYIDGYGTIPRARKTLLQSELQRKYLTECTNNQKMPPELIVTPAKNPPQSSRSVEREEIKRTVISPAITEFPPIGSGARRTNSWHNLNKCGPKTKIQTVNPLMRSDNPDNLQIKLNLKKQIWTGVNPDDRTRPLSWGIPPIMMKKKAPKDDHEALLTACSQRLAAWQETESGPSSAKPKNKMMINLIAPEVSEKVPRPRKTPSSKALLKPEPTPTEPKEKKKRNPLSKIAETTQILSKMAKTKGRTSMPQRKLSSCNTALTGGLSIIQPLAPLKGHKFKTGGIVATAVQPIKKKKSRCSVLQSLKIEKSESEIEKSYVNKKVKIKSKKKKSKIS